MQKSNSERNDLRTGFGNPWPEYLISVFLVYPVLKSMNKHEHV